MIEEYVVYRIKGDPDDFLDHHRRVIAAISTWPGFVGAKTQIGLQDRRDRLDRIRWLDEAAALNAFENFRSLASAQKMMQRVERVWYSGHFHRENEMNGPHEPS